MTTLGQRIAERRSFDLWFQTITDADRRAAALKDLAERVEAWRKEDEDFPPARRP